MAGLTCTIPGCSNEHHARGLCPKHYLRWRRFGTTDDPPPTPKGVVRDCQCKRVHHEHGTLGAYMVDRCRCQPCRKAAARRAQQRERNIAYGRWTDGRVPADGTRRRLEALMWVGWSVKRVVEATDGKVGLDTAHRALGVGRRSTSEVKTRVADAIAEAYEALLRLPPPRDQSASVARNAARRRGYVSPWAWDDIDDPAAKPTGAKKAA